MDLSFVLRRSIALVFSFLSCTPPPTLVPSPKPVAHAAADAGVSQVGEETFHWHGRIQDGRALDVRNVDGSIVALPASGEEAEVVATKSGPPDALADLTVRVEESGAGVVVCVTRGEPASSDCRSRHAHDRLGDVRVDFALRVPRGARLVASTCNGNVSAESLQLPVDLASVNGSLRATGVVPSRAATVNGSIVVSMPAGWAHDVELKTVNGNIDLSLPDGSDADLDASAVHGLIEVRLPVTRMDGSRDMHIVLGRGGRELRARTVNGTIRLGRVT